MALDLHHSLTHSLSHRHAHWLNDRGCQDSSRESSSINAAHAHFTAPHSSPLSCPVFTRTEVLAQASTHTQTHNCTYLRLLKYQRLPHLCSRITHFVVLRRDLTLRV
ncbi:expressed protein [Echinococcus multilocularis]|uniref:Expressed protein n=1 Tax=Echinococcus multilocularis TaxID=6211 RepID=A0A087VY38_ECHMU|nr:expressed protein [Echinococcus multilocularis]